jgi:hypothetical protein
MRMKTVKPFGRRLADDPLRVSLCDRNPDVVRALANDFHDVGGVEVLEGDLLGLDCDALVSPANSFGYMDGGVEKHIDGFYQGEAQRTVLVRIAERHYGELPVGSAAILEMATRRFPYLVVSPTMRVPGDDLGGTIHAYLADAGGVRRRTRSQPTRHSADRGRGRTWARDGRRRDGPRRVGPPDACRLRHDRRRRLEVRAPPGPGPLRDA